MIKDYTKLWCRYIEFIMIKSFSRRAVLKLVYPDIK